MSVPVVFNGKTETRPGSYSRILSGINNPPSNLPYGNILIIDTGTNFTRQIFCPGIAGETKQNKKSIVTVDNPLDYQAVCHYGLSWSLAKQLFKPEGDKSSSLGPIKGVNKVYIAKAAATTRATITMAFDASTLVFKTVEEGIIANGILSSTYLQTGFAVKMKAGLTSGTYQFDFYLGNYKGVDFNSIPYYGANLSIPPILLCTSPEVTNSGQLRDWMQSNAIFQQYFTYISLSASEDFIAGDLTDFSGFTVATGATETYSNTNLDLVLDAVKDLDYTFVFIDKFGTNSTTGGYSTSHLKVLEHILTTAKFEKYLMVAGGYQESDWSVVSGGLSTLDLVDSYDSNRVILVHGGYGKNEIVNKVKQPRYYTALNKMAMVLGRICGLPPQVPVTFKGLDYDQEVHELTDKQIKAGLAAGVLMTAYDDDLERFAVVQGVTTTSKNENLVNEDATSHEISFERIKAHLNKLVQVNSKKELLGTENGPNRNVLSVPIVETWLKGFLQRKGIMANDLEDGLILSFQDVKVRVVSDSFYMDYSFVANFPINKLLITGTVLDPTINS